MQLFKINTEIAELVYVQNFPLSDGTFITGPICNGKTLNSFGLDCRVGDGKNWVRNSTENDIKEVLLAAKTAEFIREPDFGIKKHGGEQWADKKVFGNAKYISCGWSGFPTDIIENAQTTTYGRSYVFFPDFSEC